MVIGQSVAVGHLKGEDNGSELVIKRRDGHALSVLNPVHQDVVVSHKRSFRHAPCQVTLFVLHVVSQIGEAEGVGVRVFINTVVNQSVSCRVGSNRVNNWTCSQDVNG